VKPAAGVGNFVVNVALPAIRPVLDAVANRRNEEKAGSSSRCNSGSDPVMTNRLNALQR